MRVSLTVKVKAGRSGGEVLQEGDQDCQPFTGRAGEAERVGEELTEGFNRRQLDPRVTTPTPVTAFTKQQGCGTFLVMRNLASTRFCQNRLDYKNNSTPSI